MRRTLWLAAGVLWVGAAGVAAAAGGTATDQAVGLTYPPDHWGDTEPGASLTGVDPIAAPLRSAGWWYRVAGDTRERILPPPTQETYTGGRITATYSDLGGSGITLTEVTEVVDTEGPSGGFVTYLFAQNRSTARKTLTLFHYLDVDLQGTALGDFAADLQAAALADSEAAVVSRAILLSEHSTRGTTRALYRAPRATHFRAGTPVDLKAVLNDTSVTDLNDAGLPFGPGDVAAAYQFGPIALDPCTGNCAGTQVAAASLIVNPLDFRVKGDALGLLGQSPLLLDGGNAAYLVPMRRTQALGLLSAGIAAPTATARPAGVDDFNGDLLDELVFRDTRTGAAYVGQTAITGAPVLPLSWKLSATGDFDRDGRADILWRNTVSQKLVVWLMNGAAKRGSTIPSPDQAASPNWEVAGAADFNGDGNRDLLWYNQTTGKIVMWYLDENLARSTGLFTTPNGVGSNTWRVVAVGDFGQGAGGVHDAQDIVWQNDLSHKTVVWHMDRSATRTSGVFTTPDAIAGGLPVAGPR